MNYIKHAIKRGLLGIPIGVFINQTICILICLFSNAPTDINTNQAVIQYISSILIGFIFASSSVLFEIDEWSLLKQTSLHFIILTISYSIVGTLAGWLSEQVTKEVVPFILYFASFLVIYIILWFLFQTYWNKKIKKINETLKKRNKY